MPWTGSAPNKTYVRTDGVRSGAAINTTAKGLGINNTAALADTREQDQADAISLALTRDGGTQPSVDLPMNTFKHLGVGAAAARDQYARFDQVQDGDFAYAEAGGTANAITLTSGISTTPVEGMSVEFIAEADNTAATTIDYNGGGAVALQVYGAACVGGEVNNGQAHRITFDGTQWQLQNSARLDSLDKTDGNFLVADGTKWITESGSTARDSIGLGTAATPQFASLEIGHATDTSLTRDAAGELAVEGNRLYRVGGTDVAIADGGTGAGTAAAAFTALKQAASDTDTGVVELAVQSEMETGTDTTRAVVPGRQHFHPGHPKFWCLVSVSFIGTATLTTSYNVSGITDAGIGELTVTIATDFSSADWAPVCNAGDVSDFSHTSVLSKTAGACECRCVRMDNGAQSDPEFWGIAGFGDL